MNIFSHFMFWVIVGGWLLSGWWFLYSKKNYPGSSTLVESVLLFVLLSGMFGFALFLGFTR